jgi:hypothetical protein
MRCPRLVHLVLARDEPARHPRPAAHLLVCDACCRRLARFDLQVALVTTGRPPAIAPPTPGPRPLTPSRLM